MFENPRNVNSLIGFKAASADFLNAFNSSRMHHAWMICGNKGIGKATLAYNIAKFLLTNPKAGAKEIQFDETDSIVRKIENLSHPDLMVLESDDSEGNPAIKVDDVRKIGQFLSLTSVESRYRVVIIDSINDMNASAANALLKVLEEPSHNVIFLLTCHQLGQVLPTVRSRCRLLKLTPPTKEVFGKVISEKLPTLDATYIDELYELSGGSYGKISFFLDSERLDVYRQASDVINNPNPSMQDVLSLSQLAQDEENWKIISFVIESNLHKNIKERAISGERNVISDLEKFARTKKFIADGNQFHLDKSYIVTALLS